MLAMYLAGLLALKYHKVRQKLCDFWRVDSIPVPRWGLRLAPILPATIASRRNAHPFRTWSCGRFSSAVRWRMPPACQAASGTQWWHALSIHLYIFFYTPLYFLYKIRWVDPWFYAPPFLFFGILHYWQYKLNKRFCRGWFFGCTLHCSRSGFPFFSVFSGPSSGQAHKC